MNTSNPAVNPFLKAMISSKNLSSLPNKDSQQANTATQQRNVFKQPGEKKDQDRQNNQNQVNFAAPLRNVRELFQKPSAAALNAERSSVGHSTARDKVQLEVKMNGQACEVKKTKEKQLTRLSDLSKQNIQVAVSVRESQEINKNMMITSHIIDSLESLHQRIRENNSNILSSLKKVAIKDGRDYVAIRLRKDQHVRLLKGLYYYHHESSSASKTLAVCLRAHSLGKSVFMVASKLSLDVLMAYYVVRSVCENKGIIPKGLASFFVQDANILPQAEMLTLSEEFLKQDKKDLLNCYLELMKCNLPSSFRLLKRRQELDILWANLVNFQKEDSDIKELIVAIFLRYWSLSDPRIKDSRSELAAIKQKMLRLKLSDSDKTKMIEIGINDALNQDLGNLKENEFEGPFKELYLFFLRQKFDQFDQDTALMNLSKVQLSSAWHRHVQSYLQRLLASNSQIAWEQMLYVNKVLQKLKINKILFPIRLRQRLVTKVIKECSIILGFIYLQDVCADIQSPSLISTLFNIGDKQLRLCYNKERILIRKWLQDKSYLKILDVGITFLQSSIVNYIQLNDISSLEREFSMRGSYNFDVASQNFHFLKQYCEFMLRNPAMMGKIQQNINEVIHMLQKRNTNISKILHYYHHKVLMLIKDIKILSTHFNFLFTVGKDINELASLARSFINKIEADKISNSFSDFPHIICMVGNKLLETDEQSLLDIFVRICDAFKSLIIQSFCNSKTIDSNCFNLYYMVKKIIDWSYSSKTYTQDSLIRLSERIKHLVIRYWNDIRVIFNMKGIKSPVKLFLLCQVISSDHKDLQTSVKDYFSSQQQIKGEIYEIVSADLKGKQDTCLIETLSLAAHCDRELLQTLIEQNISNLSQSINTVKLSLTILQHLISIGAALSVALKTTRVQKQVEIFLRGIIFKVLQVYKQKAIPLFVFKGIFLISKNLLNRIEYRFHIEILEKGWKSRLLVEVEEQIEKNCNHYFLYLLCISLNKSIENEINSKIQLSIEIFTEIVKILIIRSSKQQLEVTHFLSKYLQLLECQMENHGNIERARERLCLLINQVERQLSDSEILSMLSAAQQKLKIEDRKLVQMRDFYQMKSVSLSDRIIGIFIAHHIKDEHENEAKKIIMEMDKNPHVKIVWRKGTNENVFSNKKSLTFLDLTSKIVERLDFSESSKNIWKHIVKYVNINPMNEIQEHSIEYYKATTCYLKILNQLVSKSVLSPLLILQNAAINDQIIKIYSNLRKDIDIWLEVPSNQILKLLHQIEIDIDYWPQQWKQSKAKSPNEHQRFTIWKLIQFRQKIEFSNELLIFSRVTIGLLPKNCCESIQQITSFIRFYSQNIQRWREKENKQKIKTTNKLLEGSRLKFDDSLYFIGREINLNELTAKCVEMANNLSFLNVEVGSHAIEKLSQIKKCDL